MAKIEEINKVVIDFLKKVFNVEEIRVIKTAKDEGGWLSEAEVYEQSSFIKSLGLPTRVQDRNIYEVRLSGNLEVVSYARKEETS